MHLQDTVHFLASDAARSITGVNIPVDQVLQSSPRFANLSAVTALLCHFLCELP